MDGNPQTARSQLIGGMTMGLSMALHEESVLDPRFGHVVNQDFAGYHVAANADVKEIEAIWLGEPDPHASPVGTRGLGEIGIVGAAAAIATPSTTPPAAAHARCQSHSTSFSDRQRVRSSRPLYSTSVCDRGIRCERIG